jgi:hypothetical protein
MSIKACLKEKMGYSKFYYNPEITKIHNNADARVLVLAGLRLGLKNRQVGEKWVSDDCSYLCKGL